MLFSIRDVKNIILKLLREFLEIRLKQGDRVWKEEERNRKPTLRGTHFLAMKRADFAATAMFYTCVLRLTAKLFFHLWTQSEKINCSFLKE